MPDKAPKQQPKVVDPTPNEVIAPPAEKPATPVAKPGIRRIDH